MFKDYLKSKSVVYEEVDVGVNEEARKEMFDKSHQMGVPVADINGVIVVGFDRESVDRALNPNK